MAQHNDFGKWGEDVAVDFLIEQGFEILARNWRHEHLEVDIIATKDDRLFFVEVKTRHGEEWRAEGAVNTRKRSLLWRATMAWKLQHPSTMNVCYSIVAVVVHDPDAQPEIRWYEDAEAIKYQ